MRRLGLLTLVLGACLALPVGAGAATFTFQSNTQIDLGPNAGAGSPYPSTITVSGLSGTPTDVNVRFGNLIHGNPDDIDVALVSPAGVAVHLMSDACAGSANLFRLFSFDDAAGGFMSDNGDCPAGTYKPSNFDGAPEPYLAPGPATTLNSLSFFNAASPNGAWNLFAQDDANNNSGSIGGWTLTLDGLEVSQQPGASAPNPGAVICAGRPSTQLGTDGDDALVGTPGPDVISGIGGNDELSGTNGKDVICGGDGKDILRGGKGKDRLLGQAGKDKLRGGKGKDILKGGPGKDNERQ